jgi:hypothetical protein
LLEHIRKYTACQIGMTLALSEAVALDKQVPDERHFSGRGA